MMTRREGVFLLKYWGHHRNEYLSSRERFFLSTDDTDYTDLKRIFFKKEYQGIIEINL